jgi:hypothetical protein
LPLIILLFNIDGMLIIYLYLKHFIFVVLFVRRGKNKIFKDRAT